MGLRMRGVRRCIDRCAAAIVAISRRNADVLRLPDKTEVVYNFVDFGHFDRRLDRVEARRALGLPVDLPIVLMLGGIVPHKGSEILVEAAARMQRTRPEILFVVAGYAPTGEESPSMSKRVLRRWLERTGFVRNVEREVLGLMKRNGLADTVRFVGVRSDVPRLLAASNLLVWPATVSHFSRPIIEAGAMAVPVVASDNPAARELVVHGTTGLLVRGGRPLDLATGILDILSDPERARRMGEAGYELARERYDAGRNAARTFAVYDRVLAGVAGA
jgi:glycosyltransferase involved in cell wall biosynthesis